MPLSSVRGWIGGEEDASDLVVADPAKQACSATPLTAQLAARYMRTLLHHGTHRSIARFWEGHTVVEAIARGWERLERLANGALLKAAEDAGFDLLLSTDKNIQYQ